jgi:hypothetical protein
MSVSSSASYSYSSDDDDNDKTHNDGELKSVRTVRSSESEESIQQNNNSVSTTNSTKKSESIDPNIDQECVICMEDKKKSDFFTLDGCKHEFCDDCMFQYLLEKIDS